jgi:hypothetical protein
MRLHPHDDDAVRALVAAPRVVSRELIDGPFVVIARSWEVLDEMVRFSSLKS